ncbi:flagellar motor switch protein FliM [Pseudoroseomonas cervicalis]|uniref:flagellar motor switch protein FliM n=1 Tax=Teichococcus cervicalis TaxID=204525 RepID=UPI0022F1AA22|nr:flagellar motor switch protein FliM [Pseudoroseomonas cervicalis]WBV44576.1 flagellar motor switch protein FliM [Pseudoroseomonas cervicalis]
MSGSQPEDGAKPAPQDDMEGWGDALAEAAANGVQGGEAEPAAPAEEDDGWGEALAAAAAGDGLPAGAAAAAAPAAGAADADDGWGEALAKAAEAQQEEGGDDAWGEALAAAVGPAAAPPPPAPEPARVLSQAEIDSLLGFGDGGQEDDESATGIEKVIARGLVSYERLPMLEIVFDRLVRIMSTSLRNFTSDNVEVSIEGITSLRFGDYLNTIPLPAMLVVFKAEEWDNYGLVVVDSALIYSVVDVLLGGRRGTTAMRIEGRPYTTIERGLIERLTEVVLKDLSDAFGPLAEVEFRFERLEVNPRFAAISRPSNAAVLARLRVDMESRGGQLQLLLPYATLEPVRELLLQQFMGEKFGRDSIWETHLAEELRQTEVALDVVLDEQTMRLSDVVRLQVGDLITLGVGPGAPVRLRCGDTSLFEGQVGGRKGRLAVRIDRAMPRQVDGLRDPARPGRDAAERAGGML